MFVGEFTSSIENPIIINKIEDRGDRGVKKNKSKAENEKLD
jgi:hypothetical protein